MGISASPSCVVQGRYLLGGCQESAVFLDLFQKIAGLKKEGESEEAKEGPREEVGEKGEEDGVVAGGDEMEVTKENAS